MEGLGSRIQNIIAEFGEVTARREFGDSAVDDALGVPRDELEPCRIGSPALSPTVQIDVSPALDSLEEAVEPEGSTYSLEKSETDRMALGIDVDTWYAET